MLERIRRLAKAQADESERRAYEAHKAAEEHLPLWVKLIEKVIQGGKCLSVSLDYVKCGFWTKDKIYLTEGSDLDFNLVSGLFDIMIGKGVPPDVYASELNKIFGKPFFISPYYYVRKRDIG